VNGLTGALWRGARAAGPGAVWRLVLAALAAAVTEAAGVGLTATAVWLICRAAQQPPLAVLAVAIVLVRALAIGRGGFRYVERLIGHDTVLRVLAGLRGRLFDALVPLAPTGLTGLRRGDLVTNAVSDVDAVQDLLLRVAIPKFASVVVGATALIWAVKELPSAGIALGAGLVLAGFVVPALAASAQDGAGERLRAAKAELAATTVDLVEGVEDLLVNGAAERFAERNRAAARAVAALERRRARVQGRLEAASLLAQLLTTAAVGWLAIGGQQAGRLDSVMVAVLVLVTLTTLEVARPLRAAGEQLGTQLAAIRRLRAIFALSTPDEPAEPKPAPARPVSVVVEGLTLTYPEADRPALSGVDLTVPAGARVAVVGPSGSGKSTLLLAVARLARPDAGRISLSGTDIADLSGTDLRPGLVGALTQDARLFAGSVRSNLLLAKPDASTDELWAALDRAGAADWVRGTADGLDSLVGRDGDQVSGGERQRLTLAMALLSDPDVLLLDEPTESLDPETADTVLADAIRAAAGHTLLVVSHRLRGLEGMDTIVVLQDGRVTQCGAPADLVAVPGYYREQYLAEVAAPELLTTR
jgi:ATP-binding cassette, subfamily C, bacterial CydC